MIRGLRTIRSALQPAVGKAVERRWPWPVWRMQGFATLPIGPETFAFYDAALSQYAWWAHMAHRRRWETSVISELTSTLRPGDVFFDVGAFIGAFSLLASRRVGTDGHVVAFEPDPCPRATLEKNLATNRAENVTVAPYAVGSDQRLVSFIARGDSASHVVQSGGIEVPQVTLDGYCSEAGLKPAIMKMDIEGSEYARPIHEQHRP